LTWNAALLQRRLLGMGFKQITISTAFLAACSSAACSSQDGSPRDGSPTVADSSGSQTGGEGIHDVCKTVSVTEIDVDEARALGFAVDEHLALFDRTFEEPFHRGNLDCSTLPPSIGGQIQVRASLQRIDVVRREPTWPEAPETCPTLQRTYLQYRALVEIATDEGTLAGSFEGSAGASLPGAPGHAAGLGFIADGEEPALFRGSLGIRVDPSRAYVGKVSGQVSLGTTPSASWLFTIVSYSDGEEPFQDQGDGLFWPFDFQDVNGERPCGWLDMPGEQRAPIGIDDFNDL
jgi:hypothetical protein